MSTKYVAVLTLGMFFVIALFVVTRNVTASPPQLIPTPTPGRAAIAAEIQKATAEWLKSAHANTFDRVAGANTTCALQIADELGCARARGARGSQLQHVQTRSRRAASGLGKYLVKGNFTTA